MNNNHHAALVLNCGSSSLKFAFFKANEDSPCIEGIAEELNSPNARLKYESPAGKESSSIPLADHSSGLEQVLPILPSAPDVIGHRIVHGGETFRQPALITPEVIEQIKSCVPLAPLHNPAGLIGIQTTLSLYPEVPQVAVFDTAFHQTLPARAYRYALPEKLYIKHGVRRYGFHGTSHAYVAQAAASTLGFALAQSRILSAHLGNGSSATAIRNGESVDTTMGLTPLEGLVMGTRSGDVDPGLHDFLSRSLAMDSEAISHLLNKESGLLGLSGETSDMRRISELANQGQQAAVLAIEIFCYRLAKSLAALCIASGGVDTLIFTGGIGENAAPIRQRVLELLAPLGFMLEPQLNDTHGSTSNGIITKLGSIPQAMVIATNEELMIATLSRKTIS